MIGQTRPVSFCQPIHVKQWRLLPSSNPLHRGLQPQKAPLLYLRRDFRAHAARNARLVDNDESSGLLHALFNRLNVPG